MTNKINGLRPVVTTVDVAAPFAAKPSGSKVDASIRSGDSLELTDSARLLGGAATEMPMDAARVARLRDAIASGTYPIDPERIAAKLLPSSRSGGKDD